MKAIFLDFDGVLNSTVSFITHKKAREAGLVDVFANPDASCVTLVDRLILSDPAIRVVVSSTWRHGRDVPLLRETLTHDFGMSEDAAAMVIGKTPTLARFTSNGFRGHEIREWLEEAYENHPSDPVTHYVILDDNSDMTDEQKAKHFVQTNFDDGFRWKDYQKARDILQVPEDRYIVMG